jgi:hypothetical protein
MTNGIVHKASGTTLVVHYQDGSQTISAPASVPVTEVATGKVTLAAGDAVYAVTAKQKDGALASNRIFVVSTPAPKKTNLTVVVPFLSGLARRPPRWSWPRFAGTGRCEVGPQRH